MDARGDSALRRSVTMKHVKSGDSRHDRSMATIDPTPLPEDRPFEQLALGSAELCRACWTWIPVLTGLVLLPMLTVPLTVICALGGLWRTIELRKLRQAGLREALPAAWMAWTLFWSIGGLAVAALMLVNMLVGSTELGAVALTLWRAWIALVWIEVLLAAAWVSSGAVERGSLWAALLQAAGLGLSSLALAIVAFLFLIDGVEPPSGPVGLVLRAVSVGAGAIGALLVADGVARLLQSMSGESLDEESDSDAARRAG